MQNLDELKQLGQGFLERFEDVDFVGEIEMSEAELDEVFPALWKAIFRGGFGFDEDLTALLTTVVVNLAYFSREDFETRSFRWLVLEKLRGSKLEDTLVWEEFVGAPVLKTLKRFFQAEERPGANKYVRPIMQQAGVPHSTLPQFVEFFIQLISRNGYPFSHRDYSFFQTGHSVTSGNLNSFLETKAGWNYCREVARILRNIESRLLTNLEVEALNPRFRETIKTVRERLSEGFRARLIESKIPYPRFALDKQTYRLIVLFSEKGVGGLHSSYRLDDGTLIYQTSFALKGQHFDEGVIRGSVVRGKTKAYWEVELWQPEQASWGVFNVSTGAFVQSSGKLPPGEYLVVIPDGCPISNVLEDYGYLNFPGDGLFRIYHAELRQGYSIPDIGLFVGTDLLPVPQLRFANSIQPLRFTDNIFVGQTPTIEVVNWEPSLTTKYLISFDDGKIKRRIGADNFFDSNKFQPMLSPPGQGEVNIEAVGKISQDSSPSALPFTVLPSGFRFFWTDVLYEMDAQPILSFSAPSQVSLVWHDECLENCSPNEWRALPKVNFLEMRLQYADSVTFSVVIPVYRFSLTSELIIDRSLWHASLSEPAKLSFLVSKNERRQNMEIGLSIDENFHKICDLPKVPDNLELVISPDVVRDGFEDSGEVAGIIAIKTRSGRVIRSDVTYVNEKLIIEKAFDDDFDTWKKLLPESLQLSIISVRDTAALGGDERAFPDVWIPDELKQWIKSYEPHFNKFRELLVEWAAACREEHWSVAEQLELSRGENGAKLTKAAWTYYYAVEAHRNFNLGKYNRSLISAYRQLDNVKSAKNNLITEMSKCLRMMCCVRLDKKVEDTEFHSLGPRWNSIKLLMQSRLEDHPVWGGISEVSNSFALADIAVHNDDLDYFSGPSGKVSGVQK